MSNLIVFLQSFPCMFVGFNVRVECERLVKNCEEQSISQLTRDWLASGQLLKGHVRSTCWKLKSEVPGSISCYDPSVSHRLSINLIMSL